MPKLERTRDFVAVVPSQDYFEQRTAEGWRLHSIEWERGEAAAQESSEDIPFGLRVAGDCRRLEEDPQEIEVLTLLMEVIVSDGPLSRAAQVINQKGYRTREGSNWSAAALFRLLPRLIDIGPRLSKSTEWAERRKRLLRVG